MARDGPFGVHRVGRLLGQLCAVLQAAHDRGIVHRDLKPANIMVVEPGTPRESLKVLDFGLARQLRDPSRGLYLPLEQFVGARAHKTIGTPEYACPEQFRGEQVDSRGDLYSVGVILFELLTGRLPFAGATSAELVAAHLHAQPPPLDLVIGLGRITPVLEVLVHGCLAKDPADRPPSARELALGYGAAIRCSIWDEREATVRDAAPPATPPDGAAHADRSADVFRLEAWMPQAVAAIKLRGFVDDRGEVRASAPGYLRVSLRMQRKTVPGPRPQGLFARLGLGRKSELGPAFEQVDVDVLTTTPDTSQPSKLLVTVRMHTPKLRTIEEATQWLDWCKQVQMDLAAYLMARSVN